jgi:hypothetical protein
MADKPKPDAPTDKKPKTAHFHVQVISTSQAPTAEPVHSLLVDAKPNPNKGLLKEAPFHDKKEDIASLEADCFLQLWELDVFKDNRSNTLQEYDLGDDGLPGTQHLLATWPGVIVLTGKNQYQFRATEDPTVATDDFDEAKGRLKISLTKTDSNGTTVFYVNLTKYEAVLELVPVIVLDKNDRSMEDPTATAKISPYPVKNVRASVFYQDTHRGGLAVAFVADYYDQGDVNHADPARIDDKHPNASWCEFAAQAEEMIAMTPTFKVGKNGLQMGYYLIKSPTEIPAKLEEVRNAAKDVLEADEPPPIYLIEIYCHGMRFGGELNKWANFGMASIKPLCEGVAPHAAPHLTMALFACNMGMGLIHANNDITKKLVNGQHGDDRFGIGHPCEELGSDSFGWTMMRTLLANDIDNPTVYAHTLAAHTTRNPYLRCFSPLGCLDMVNILGKAPRIKGPGNPYTSSLFRGSGKTLPFANYLRGICLTPAMYLPLEWYDSEFSPQKLPFLSGYHPRAQSDADGLLRILTKRVENQLTVLPEEVLYEDTRRRFITGITDPTGKANPRLSPHLQFSDLPAGVKRVSVDLLRMIQLLMERSQTLLQIAAINNGLEATLNIAKPTAVATVKKKADEMLTQKLLAAVALDGSALTLSVSAPMTLVL